jgi:hypothetical protein
MEGRHWTQCVSYRSVDGEEERSLDPTSADADTDSDRRRDLLERAWFVLSMLYAVLRIVLAGEFLVEYGLNLWVFAAIEFLSTPLYAIGASRGVRALMDGHRSSAIRWFMLAVAGFVAPDAYVVIAARHVPKSLYIAVLVWVVLGTLLGFRRLRRQIKRTTSTQP